MQILPPAVTLLLLARTEVEKLYVTPADDPIVYRILEFKDRVLMCVNRTDSPMKPSARGSGSTARRAGLFQVVTGGEDAGGVMKSITLMIRG